ncbi:MAG TPA: TOBE domain-containing protein, partial [Inquilinus sp.]
AHTFVGYFIGSPGINLLPCVVDQGDAVIDGGRIPLSEPARQGAAAFIAGGAGKLELGIRPEFLEIADSGIPAAVTGVEDLGTYLIVTLRLGAATVKAKLAEGRGVPVDTAHLRFPPDRTLLYADGRLVG